MDAVVIQKLTAKQREQMRWMYLGNFEAADIAAKLSIEIDTVRFFIFGEDGSGKDPKCLYQIKKEMSSTAISHFLMDKASAFERTAGVALQILTKSLTDLHKEVQEGKELSLDDMKKLSSIVTEMDKLNRLESGMATEVVEYLGLSRSEAREILAADPFAPKDIEAEVINSNEALPWLK